MKTKFVSRLNELRGEMSVSAFARRVNMPQPTIDRYFKGRVPSIEVLSTICITFGVSADWLLGLSDVRTTTQSVEPPMIGLNKRQSLQRDDVAFELAAIRRQLEQQQREIAALMAELQSLKRRVIALESSSPMATCG